MASILLKTDVPGPKSRAVLARRTSAVPSGLGKATEVVVERADGALVHDVDGNTFLDFVGGIGALAVGHCPPPVVEAVQRQSGSRCIHMGSLVATYESYSPPLRAAQRADARDPSPRRRCSPTPAPRPSRTRSRPRAPTPGGPGSSASRAAITAARCSRSA